MWCAHTRLRTPHTPGTYADTRSTTPHPQLHAHTRAPPSPLTLRICVCLCLCVRMCVCVFVCVQGQAVVQSALMAEMEAFVQHVLKVCVCAWAYIAPDPLVSYPTNPMIYVEASRTVIGSTAHVTPHPKHHIHPPTPQTHGAGRVLQSLSTVSPNASSLLLHILSLLVPESQPRPRPPPADLVTAAKALREARWVSGGVDMPPNLSEPTIYDSLVCSAFFCPDFSASAQISHHLPVSSCVRLCVCALCVSHCVRVCVCVGAATSRTCCRCWGE